MTGAGKPAMAHNLRQWVDHVGVRRILEALDARGGQTRFVGGAVRDSLLGIDVTDLDLATRFQPAEVIDRLERAGVRAVPTGIAHGTITAVADDAVIEVTTLRRDVATDGRHAVVAFTDDWREDAARRDFTMNALYADPFSGTISDYFGGVDDLEQRRVRFIGEPLERIAEDHLRILRFFRFHARFGEGLPDEAALAACRARANDLMALSRERIRDELLKLLCVADPAPTLELMLASGIVAAFLPEASADHLPALRRLVRLEAASGEGCVALRRLATLLPAEPAVLDSVAARLRLSVADRKRLVAMGRRPGVSDDPPARLAYRLGATGARDLLLLSSGEGDDAGTVEQLAGLREWQRPRFPLSGGDLLDLGARQGQTVGAILRTLEERWVNSGFALRRDQLLAQARDLIASG